MLTTSKVYRPVNSQAICTALPQSGLPTALPKSPAARAICAVSPGRAAARPAAVRRNPHLTHFGASIARDAEVFPNQGEGGRDDLVHVEVTILSKAADEMHIWLGLGQGEIALE